MRRALVCLLLACGRGQPGPPPPADTTPPAVAWTTPVQGARDEPVNTVIHVVFGEPLDCATVTVQSFGLFDPSGANMGVVPVCGGTDIAFAPPTLQYSTTYQVRVNANVKDHAGNPLGADYVLQFTTAGQPLPADTIAPTVADATPIDASVPAMARPQAVFSEPMDCATLTTATFFVEGVAGSVTCAGPVATFIPDAPLAYSTQYTARVTAGATDPAGNGCVAKDWTFTTRAAPTVTVVSPAAGEAEVATVAPISLTFDSSMEAASFGPSTFWLEPAADGTFAAGGNAATFTPSAPLAHATQYTVHLTSGLRASDGSPLVAPPPWSFTSVGAGAGTWAATSQAGAPSPRAFHTAVWTGSEMIVWGGVGDGYLRDGARYSPASDSWMAMTDAPLAGRAGHVAVWTGSEMIVWGGFSGAYLLDDGARYDPAHDRWTLLPSTGAPVARTRPTAIWTGDRMIVWGGYGRYGYCDDGAELLPAGGWSAMPGGAPAARTDHTAVWDGARMLVFGGDGDFGALFGSGALYTPGSGWSPMATDGQPAFRGGHVAVWTGSEMLVWGGANYGGALNDGGRLAPGSGWSAMSPGPHARSNASAVWTGGEMIVWGGYYDTGGRYSPALDAWTTTATPAIGGRERQTAVWTGAEMIVWGGYLDGGGVTATGGRYTP